MIRLALMVGLLTTIQHRILLVSQVLELALMVGRGVKGSGRERKRYVRLDQTSC